jgi:hypothetical protein
MLFNTIGTRTREAAEELEREFKVAMGCENPYSANMWQIRPSLLPNLEPITESDFWGLFTQKTPKAIAWMGQDKFVRTDTGKLTPATAKAIWYDRGHMAGAGHLGVYFHDYKKERVQYYSFSACAHDWHEHSPRMCYHVVTCAKCKATYDYHSD